MGEVSATVQPYDLWIADRNFCVNSFLCAIARATATFIVREHAQFASKPLEPMRHVDDTLSEYYLAAEIANTSEGMIIAVDEADWARFANASREELCALLLDLAARVDLAKLRKTTRGPKKPRTPKTKYKGKTHVSTSKVLAGT